MKTCFKCGERKTLGEFYAHPAMADGRLNKCKDCTRKDVRRTYYSNHTQRVQYDRDRSRNMLRVEQRAKSAAAHKRRHPDRYAARTAVGNAVRDGRLKKKPCEHCGASERVQAHHHDYSKPLDVTWLCFRCHREHEHGQLTEAAPF